MQIKNSTALVTGANRGIGKCFVQELAKRGAKKIYASARDAASLESLVQKHPDIVHSIELDITDHDAISSTAVQLSDVDLVINNAGVNQMSAFVASNSLTAARNEMEVNYFGTLAMSKAFAPVLKANGGGGMINMLSILARVNLPMMGFLMRFQSSRTQSGARLTC